MAGEPTEVVENSEPLKYTTWVLRVSIHCEGCKRKVKKILHSVDGVYTIDVDSKLHKVTVTGNVDSNILIRKLEKAGKHAELWSRSKRNNDQETEQRVEEQGNQNPTVEEAQKNGEPQPQTPPENSNSDNGNMGNGNSNAQPVIKEVRFEGNIPVSGDDKTPPENNPGGGGGGGGKKKKKKKKNNSNNSNGAATAAATPNNNNGTENGGGEQQPNGGQQSTESAPPEGPPPGPYPNPSPVNMSPPHHSHRNRVYEYPPSYYAPPPPPVYAVSYSAAYPSYSASYYSAPTPYSYAYVNQGPDVDPPPPSDWSYAPSLQPSNTFEMFSDENPNACSVM